MPFSHDPARSVSWPDVLKCTIPWFKLWCFDDSADGSVSVSLFTICQFVIGDVFGVVLPVGDQKKNKFLRSRLIKQTCSISLWARSAVVLVLSAGLCASRRRSSKILIFLDLGLLNRLVQLASGLALLSCPQVDLPSLADVAAVDVACWRLC